MKVSDGIGTKLGQTGAKLAGFHFYLKFSFKCQKLMNSANMENKPLIKQKT